ncbi:P-loop containing nucleoside triphosphate hydrolase [Abortiporus biennis]
MHLPSMILSMNPNFDNLVLSSHVSSDGTSDTRYQTVFVLGPSSSGKTTLCDALFKDLQLGKSIYIKEVARTVMKTHGFSRSNTGTYEMQAAIMLAQIEAEIKVLEHVDEAGHSPGKILLLSDRSAVDPIVYASMPETVDASEIRQRLINDVRFQEVLPLYRKSLFIVLQPVKEWVVDDGVRSLEDPWRYNQILARTLDELGVPFVELGEGIRDLRERLEIVKRHLG